MNPGLRFFCQLHPKQQRLQKHSGLNFWRRWKFNKSALFAFKNAQNEPIFLSMFINAFFWLMEAVFKSRKTAAAGSYTNLLCIHFSLHHNSSLFLLCQFFWMIWIKQLWWYGIIQLRRGQKTVSELFIFLEHVPTSS